MRKPKPEGKPKFHARRAARAWEALDVYQQRLGRSGRIDSELVRDLLQDCLHWFAAQKPPNDYPDPGATLTEACRLAVRGFPKELAEEDPEEKELEKRQ